MKRLNLLWVFIAGLLLSPYPAHAETSFTLPVKATVPNATSVELHIAKVDSTTNQFTPVSSMALDFDPMVLNSVNQIYLPNHYFAIDITPVGGGTNSNMMHTITFTPGATPNSNGHGLSHKATVTFVKVTGSGTTTTDTPLTKHGPKKLMKDLVGETVTAAEIQGGWLRLYPGIVSLDPNAAFKDPAGSEPFSNGDTPGEYGATLTITSTLP